MSRRMVDFAFVARYSDDVKRPIVFYERAPQAALKVAKAWAERVGVEIVEAEAKKEAAA